MSGSRVSVSVTAHTKALFRRSSRGSQVKRSFSASPKLRDAVPWLLLTKIVLGLPIGLWTYKCAILVLFQRHLIYLVIKPNIPWGAKRQSLKSYLRENPDHFKGVRVEELCLETQGKGQLRGLSIAKENASGHQITLIYAQGNASTPLYHIPIFRSLVLSSPVPMRIITYAPRSFWLSKRKGGPSQKGFLSDYQSVYRSISSQASSDQIFLMGHSIGASSCIGIIDQMITTHSKEFPLPDGVILENAFTSIPELVKEVYPNKWLPYRYLGWAVLDKWDSFRIIKSRKNDWQKIPLLILQSERDELVPRWMGDKLFRAAGDEMTRPIHKKVIIPYALHDTAYLHSSFCREIHNFIQNVRLGNTVKNK